MSRNEFKSGNYWDCTLLVTLCRQSPHSTLVSRCTWVHICQQTDDRGVGKIAEVIWSTFHLMPFCRCHARKDVWGTHQHGHMHLCQEDTLTQLQGHDGVHHGNPQHVHPHVHDPLCKLTHNQICAVSAAPPQSSRAMLKGMLLLGEAVSGSRLWPFVQRLLPLLEPSLTTSTVAHQGLHWTLQTFSQCQISHQGCSCHCWDSLFLASEVQLLCVGDPQANLGH